MRTCKEVAELLGISRAAVWQCEQRAFAKLRAELAGDPFVQELLEGDGGRDRPAAAMADFLATIEGGRRAD